MAALAGIPNSPGATTAVTTGEPMNDPAAWAVLASIFAVIVLIGLWSRASDKAKERKAKERRDYIYAKYGRTDDAERILAGTVWVGATAAQLRDTLGDPHDTDEKVLKTKRKEIWKYAHRGGNRYGIRFNLENRVVVGWDEKL